MNAFLINFYILCMQAAKDMKKLDRYLSSFAKTNSLMFCFFSLANADYHFI